MIQTDYKHYCGGKIMWADHIQLFYCKKCDEDIPPLQMLSNLEYTIKKLQKAVKDIKKRYSSPIRKKA